MIKRKGSAVWSGDLKTGKGTVSTASGVLNGNPYGFNTRFEEGKGTNPEELIAAAHASCFSMALSMILGEAKLVATQIETTATTLMEKTAEGFTVTEVHLQVRGTVPGATAQAFKEATEKAKAGCPISRLLKAKISMEASLA